MLSSFIKKEGIIMSTQQKAFLKAIKHGGSMVAGLIPFIVSAIKNVSATTINFLGLFVAIKNIIDAISAIYKYIEGTKKEKSLFKLNIVLLIFYSVYLVTFAVLQAVNCDIKWAIYLSYISLAPIKDLFLMFMYCMITKNSMIVEKKE